MTFVNWAYDCFHIVKEDRLSNHAPLHFDLSIFDIFVGAKAGATIVLVPEGISTFPIKLAEFIEENRIGVWYSVPSVLSMLVLYGNLQKYQFSNLRLILFAGEVFPVKYLKELIRAIPQAEYYNLYGPTETNVCTFYHVRELAPESMEPVPIGKACANTEAFAVNEKDEIIKRPGEVGELYVRGSSVAQGYWGDSEKTRSLFLPNRFQSYYEEKIYKTGDLVTLDDRGNYLYIGRKDHMIKSRGYRIELGEIETVLYSHPKVKEAVVIAIPDDLIGNKIKAFVVPHNTGSLTKMELEKYCSERIPSYMLPSIIEFRYSLPKTSTGKVDRKLLASEG
jgi:acyl-coenzyme A synthetase/AMP-(fatty) acid ligase